MGEFKFKIPASWPLDPYHGNSIHIVGMDGVPWPCRIAVSTDPTLQTQRRVISINRNQDDSGKLFVLYDLANRGEHLICTGTLPPENDEPYDLMVELARGTLNRLRNQVSIWEEGGLAIDESIVSGISEATTQFRESIFAESDQLAQEHAGNAIETAMAGIYDLANSFAGQICKFRREHPELPKFWIANQVGVGEQLEPSLKMDFAQLVAGPLRPSLVAEAAVDSPSNGVGIASASKEQFESCGKRVIVGPFMDASIGGMDALPSDGQDFLTRKDYVLNRTKTALKSLPSNASMLHLVSGLNGTGHRHLSYPQQLQATVDLLRVVEDSSVDLPAMISFDFPWAERLAGAVGGVHPLQIADSLLRQGVEIAFLGLDVNLDFWPNGSAIRDPLQWIDLVDIWAQLGMPLVLNLRVPMSVGDGSQKGEGSRNQVRSNLSDARRVEFLKTVLPMLVARPSVHGVILRQWQDQDDPRYPYAGLVDSQGGKKGIFEVLEKVVEATVAQ